MVIDIPDEKEKAYLRPIRLGQKYVRRTIRSPDHTERISMKGLGKIDIFSKRVIVNGREFFIVAGGTPQKDRLRLDFAFIVPCEVAEAGPSGITPLLLLEKLVDQFGLLARVAGTTARFIHYELIPLEEGEDVQLVDCQNPEDHNFVGVAHIVREQTQMRVGLCFFIDTTLYYRAVLGP